jgi:hypothetical protein
MKSAIFLCGMPSALVGFCPRAHSFLSRVILG